jgi:hypothetical protein
MEALQKGGNKQMAYLMVTFETLVKKGHNSLPAMGAREHPLLN